MRFDNLPDWLAWQETLHPRSIHMELGRVARVADRLGLVPTPFPIISVAGTNGKGSSVALLESIFGQAGYRVGAYTSPYLARYNERIRIGGREASDAALMAAFQAVDSARGDTTLTYFEFGTLAAMVLFYRARPDVVVLEVGMGGRLDAVNVFHAHVALVTTIGIDHVAWLGNDREAIGREKAGIYRAGRPAICGDPEPPASLEAHARAIGARWLCAGRDFRALPATHPSDSPGSAQETWNWAGPGGACHPDLPKPALIGEHQRQNAAAVLMAVESIRDRLPVSQAALHRGLTEARLPGRFQVVLGEDGVTRVLDVAHNPQAAEALAHALARHPCGGRTDSRTLAVVAMLADKDIEAVLRAMWGVVDAWHAASLDAPRGAKAEQAVAAMSRIAPADGKNAPVHAWASVTEAYNAALQAARPGDRVVVFGSFYTVGEILRRHSHPGAYKDGL